MSVRSAIQSWLGPSDTLVESACLVLGDPDPDQVARKVLTQGEAAQCLAREIRLHHLPLERAIVCSIPGHDFHPPEAQHGESILTTSAVRSQKRTSLPMTRQGVDRNSSLAASNRRSRREILGFTV